MTKKPIKPTPPAQPAMTHVAQQVGQWIETGNQLFRQGRLAEAVQAFRQGLALAPHSVPVQCNLAAALQQSGRREEALHHYQNALRLDANQPSVYYNLAKLYQEMGREVESEAAYRRAIQLQPSMAAAHFNLGNSYHRLKRMNEAIACYQNALHHQPNFVPALVNLSATLLEKGFLREVPHLLERAIALDPNHAENWNQKGNYLSRVGNPQEAAACYERALSLKQPYPEALYNLALVQKRIGRLREALNHLHHLIASQPHNLLFRAAAMEVQMSMCDWQDYLHFGKNLIKPALMKKDELTLLPWATVFLPISLQEQYDLTEIFTRNRLSHIKPLPPVKRPGREIIRVGYVSADFHDHATSQLMAGLFGLHDRQRFKIYGYSFGPDDGSVLRQRVVSGCDTFVNVIQHNHEEIAERIRQDEIDILVDLKGYTMDCRPEIFALRPAPIQVAYLGYPGTMAASFMDYLIGDAVVTPPWSAAGYSEKLVWLPGSYQVNDHMQPIDPQPVSRREHGLPEEAFVFCCFNANYKIEPTIWSVWMAILRRVPQGVLWLLRGSPEGEENLRRHAKAAGVDEERLIFAPKMLRPRHLARHALADLFLDTWVCNAHTTASDALWGGV
ncbi:MAG: tetratricopeptide repeat protein, partial [Magnetococcales bacterium]|nr:tetratricopeptide repeat protein [Magnetococcales bacterium]